jgi:hypothetical protein
LAVEDPEVAQGDRSVVRSRIVDIVVSVLLLGFAALMGWDNWRTGASWAPDGPQAGYFPFYLSILLAAASLYGLFEAVRDEAGDDAFVTRGQLRRVLQVLIPTFLYVLLTQFLGLYVASFLLVAGFMTFIGRMAWWKSVLTSLIFVIVLFLTFEIAFNVIMPKGPLEAAFGY